MFNNFFPENQAVYAIMWENIAELRRPHIQSNTTQELCVMDN